MKRRYDDAVRSRDQSRHCPGPEVQRLERDSFILLQHAYTVTEADPCVPVNAARLGAELGFAEAEICRLVGYLSWVGYLKQSAAGPHLALANEGIHYLEEGAGRRQTVRAAEAAALLSTFIGH